MMAALAVSHVKRKHMGLHSPFMLVVVGCEETVWRVVEGWKGRQQVDLQQQRQRVSERRSSELQPGH